MSRVQLQRANSARSAATTVMVLTTLALVSGCGAGREAPIADGEPTHAGYQRAILDIVGGDDAREASRLFTDAVAVEYDTEPCGKRVRELHERLKRVVAEVDALEPPADARAQQQAFFKAAQRSVGTVGMAAENAQRGTLSCGQSLNDRIYGLKSTEEAQSAIEDLEGAGYFVFGQ